MYRADNPQLGLHPPWLPKPAAVQAVLYMYRNSLSRGARLSGSARSPASLRFQLELKTKPQLTFIHAPG
jgi:hypothetical protein